MVRDVCVGVYSMGSEFYVQGGVGGFILGALLTPCRPNPEPGILNPKRLYLKPYIYESFSAKKP